MLITLIALIVTLITVVGMITYFIKSKNRNSLYKLFYTLFIMLFIYLLALIMQIGFSKPFNIPAVYFEYITYISGLALPFLILSLGLKFLNPHIRIKKLWPLAILPIISLLLLWTNDFHHLFYITYSTEISETVYGSWFPIHSIYTYLMYIAAIIIMIVGSIKNSGFFTKQSFLIILGSAVPLVTNILGYIGIIEISTYITPILFTTTIICYSIAIIKYKAMDLVPISLRAITDTISDSFIVVSNNGTIVNYNETFIKTFKGLMDIKQMGNLIDEIDKNNINDLKKIEKHITYNSNGKQLIEEYHIVVPSANFDKYFRVDIVPVKAKNNNIYVGTLFIFMDITQQTHYLMTIQENQERLIEKERLASLGQMIGGIAHNLKTPIMSISGAMEGLGNLVNEYKSSITDPEVTIDDHKAIASDMDTWIKKVKDHCEYMSDVISTVKEQAVKYNTEVDEKFTINELIKRISILAKFSLSKNNCELEQLINTDIEIELNGDLNSLVQVFDNLISNSIYAYGKSGGKITFEISEDKNNIIFKVSDNAGGLPENVKDKIFKEMITTKGKDGTGLGIYMSYSTIKGKFNGNMTFTTETNKGTVFTITIPKNK